MATRVNFERAKTEAGRILKENFIKEPPILPQELTRYYGLKVEYVTFDDEFDKIAGYLDFDKGTIYVNRKDSVNMQTFTIAHELGHWILHKEKFATAPDDYNVLLRIPLGRPNADPYEKEANCFAADLLVPDAMLNRYKEFANLEQLSRLFVVSKDLIRFKLRH